MTDQFTRDWITENSIQICARYEHGLLTLRALHYQLVNIGMTNSIRHYKRVVNAMIAARRSGIVDYDQFSDHDREMIGETSWEETDVHSEIGTAERQIEMWMTSYGKNRWENQDHYIEVWIEKKALQGIFGPVCQRNRVALCPCKGYPSLTFLNEAQVRFHEAESEGKCPTIIYFGDHDPSGEDIPRSIQQNLYDDFGVNVFVDIIALNKAQCLQLGLPAAPTKSGDSRSAGFTGLGQIELDAVDPGMLQDWAKAAIGKYFDDARHDLLVDAEEAERKVYVEHLKQFVKGL